MKWSPPTTISRTQQSLTSDSNHSPISKLPLETLSEIFTHVIPWILYSARNKSRVLNLALVCRAWYNAAVATHSLWTGVVLQASHGDVAYQKAVNWLRRSGTLARNLEINQLYYESADDDNTALAASRILAEGPTFYHAKVDCKGPEFFRNLVSRITAAASLSSHPSPWQTLKSFTLSFARTSLPADSEIVFDQSELLWESELSDNPALSVFQMLPPSITALDLHLPPQFNAFETAENVPHAGFIDIPPLILQQITHLDIHCDWAGAHILDVLDHCHNVKVFDINLLGESPLSPESPPLQRSRINLERLEELNLSDTGNLVHLQYIRAPSLRKLTIQVLGEAIDPDGDDSDNGSTSDVPNELYGDIPVLLRFLSASGKMDHENCLDYFRLETAPKIPPVHLSRLLHSSLQVKHLVMSDVTGIPWFGIAFAAEYASQPLLNTALEVFELLEVPEKERFPKQDVYTFLGSRKGGKIWFRGTSKHIQTPIVSEDDGLSVWIGPAGDTA